jgi:4-amino-4-deoxy-L-arabinose transferase-like glycosyltransferase
LVVVVFFTGVQTRLPHYIAPAYPALALLTSAFLADRLREFQRRRRQSTISFWTTFIVAATSVCIAGALLTTGPRRRLHEAKVNADVVYAEKESIQLLRDVFSRPQSVHGPLLVWWEGDARSIATSVFYARRPVQQVQLQPLPAGVPTDKYLFQPRKLEDSVAAGPRIILLDKDLVEHIPSELSYRQIVSGRAMEVGVIARN